MSKPEFADCALVHQLSPGDDDETSFVADLEKTIEIESEKAKAAGEGLRKIFGLLNRVSRLTTFRRTPIQMVTLNRCIEVLQAWFEDWAKKNSVKIARRRGEKIKSPDLLKPDELSDFLKNCHLEEGIIKQLVKLTKKVKTRLEAKAIEPNEWPFKQSINLERKKLSENYQFFKKFLKRELKPRDEKTKDPKANNKRELHNYNPHLDNSSIPKTYENMVAHVDTRGFHASMVSQLMANSSFKLDKVEASKVAHNTIEKLKKKIHDPLQFTLVVRRMIKFLKMLRSLKLEAVSKFIRKNGFKTNIIGKLAGKTDDELRRLEKTCLEGGKILTGKPKSKEVVDLEDSGKGLIQKKLEKKAGLQASSTGHQHSKSQKKASFEDLDVEPLPAIGKKSSVGDDGVFLKKSNEKVVLSDTDRMFEELTRKFNKRRDMILEGLFDFAEVSDTNTNGNFSEDERCSIVEQPTFSSSNMINQDFYYRLFSGVLTTHEGGTKRRFDAELFTVYGEEYIKNFDTLKEKVPIAFKPSTKEFQNYMDKVLLGNERAQYMVLPCFVKIPEEMTFFSSMSKSDSVASMKYSDTCKVFIFPSFLLKPEWLDVINFILLKDSIDTPDPTLIALLLCKVELFSQHVGSFTITKPHRIKTPYSNEMCVYTKKSQSDGSKSVELSLYSQVKENQLVPPPETNVTKLNKVWFKAYETKKPKVDPKKVHNAGKKSVYSMKKSNLLRLVEEPFEMFKEIDDNHASRTPPKSGRQQSSLDDDLPYSQARSKNDTAMISSMNLVKGQPAYSTDFTNKNMRLDLDPFSSNLYEDRVDDYTGYMAETAPIEIDDDVRQPPTSKAYSRGNTSNRKDKWSSGMQRNTQYNDYME